MEERHFIGNGSRNFKTKFYVAQGIPLTKFHPCIKNEKSRSRPKRCKSWVLEEAPFYEKWTLMEVQNKIQCDSCYYFYKKLHPCIKFNKNRSRGVKVDFGCGKGSF